MPCPHSRCPTLGRRQLCGGGPHCYKGPPNCTLEGRSRRAAGLRTAHWRAARRLYGATIAARGVGRGGFESRRLPSNGKGLDVSTLAESKVGALVVDAWNHDPTLALLDARAARRVVGAAGLADVSFDRLGACALRALFRPTPVLADAYEAARRAMKVADVGVDAAIHLRTNIEYDRTWGKMTCRDVPCWTDVAVVFATCAAAMAPSEDHAYLLVAADDDGVARATKDRVASGSAFGGRSRSGSHAAKGGFTLTPNPHGEEKRRETPQAVPRTKRDER